MPDKPVLVGSGLGTRIKSVTVALAAYWYSWCPSVVIMEVLLLKNVIPRSTPPTGISSVNMQNV